MKNNIKNILVEAIKKTGFEVPEDFDFGPPANEKFGDLSTNVAMQIAKKNSENPKEIAEKIIKNIDDKIILSSEIAGAGFINFKVDKKYYFQILAEILKAGEDFGKSDIGKGKKALVEFISANPTGQLHIGNARGGPIGEVIANVFSWLGFQVEREFYVNDCGSQIQKFGKTLAYYYIVKSDPDYHFPEGGYPGDFLKNLSEEIQSNFIEEIKKLKDTELNEFFIRKGLESAIRKIKEDIDILGIKFDKFVYESDLLNSGASQKIVEELEKKEKTVEKEGAVWFVADENSVDDRENVLVRSDADKSLTYFATDIAYHKDKFDRGFDTLVDIWGANHHGHIARLKSALSAIGCDEKKLSIILYQNVKLKDGGESMQMSKRLGNFVNISDLVNTLKVPADVFKYLIISQNSNSNIEFDLDLAKEQSEKNPVFYLQYAYARICSIIKKADTKTIDELEKIARGEASADLAILEKLADKKELELIKVLAGLPEILFQIKNDFQIQALPHFATKIAAAFHNFYNDCQVLSDDIELTKSRLLLVLATRNVLKISLTLMGISTPETM